jgi:hypothetical protein
VRTGLRMQWQTCVMGDPLGESRGAERHLGAQREQPGATLVQNAEHAPIHEQ